MFLFITILLHITLCVSDLITNLPGQPPVNFKQYSGYIVLNQTTNKSLFYWFQESQNDPHTDPVALWTNGGPGCSGLAGALIEQGAFRIAENGSLTINPGAWNNVASMLFIEQPIGVGFSYSNDDKDYIVGDERAAEDMFDMILGFLDQFPQYKTNDFYITSESYGGHYMPTLAKYIVDHNTNSAINFKGFAVGNPFTNPIENSIGEYGTYYGHQLVPRPLWIQWAQKCYGDQAHQDCPHLQAEMVIKIGDIFGEGIDWAVCLKRKKFIENRWFANKIIHETLGRPLPKWYKMDENEDIYNKRKLLQYDACAENYMSTYFNRKDVQEALHTKPNMRWHFCGGPLVYNYGDSLVPMQPNYQYLCDGGYNLKMIVYSGDDDTNCGTAGTQYWMNGMNWSVANGGSWKPWDFKGQTGGYHIKWKCGAKQNISLVTIHSAGHEVPWFKPMKALHVFEQYLKGEWS
eukprot:190869_1